MTTTDQNGEIASPCVSICEMDNQSGVCKGCFRTRDEIAIWARADDDTREDILAAVALRRARLEVKV